MGKRSRRRARTNKIRNAQKVYESMSKERAPHQSPRKSANGGQVAEIIDMTDKNRVTIMQDHNLDFQELWCSVYIAGDHTERRAFAPMFARAQCHRVDKPEDADLVVFTGGPDVDPQLYGELPHESTFWLEDRDDEDIAIYNQCVTEGIPMLGICRGAQFGHVMNGGKLYQDINNHQMSHQMFCNVEHEIIGHISSVHHQSIIPPPKGTPEYAKFKLIGVAIGAKCDKRWLNPEKCQEGANLDVEAFFYRDTCFFGIQGHPEYSGYNRFAQWTIERINDLIVLNPDIEFRGPKGNAHYRLKQELIDERKASESMSDILSKNGSRVDAMIAELKAEKEAEIAEQEANDNSPLFDDIKDQSIEIHTTLNDKGQAVVVEGTGTATPEENAEAVKKMVQEAVTKGRTPRKKLTAADMKKAVEPKATKKESK